MKYVFPALLAGSIVAGFTNVAVAQDSTVIHKESADGEHSKTVVKDEDGSKTVVKHNGNHMKKVHTDANGDKTVVKKTTDGD